MANEMNNKQHFKVKCIRCGHEYLTNGKEYNVLRSEVGCYEMKLQMCNN